MEQALSGVKVLEYCNIVTGTYCAKLITDLGAEVIKIEEPGTEDEAHHRGSFMEDMPDPERSGLFLYLNTNNLGITLNLRVMLVKNLHRTYEKRRCPDRRYNARYHFWAIITNTCSVSSWAWFKTKSTG